VDQMLAFFFVILAEFSTTTLRMVFLGVFLIRPTVLFINYLVVFLCSSCMIMNSSRKTQRTGQFSPSESIDGVISISNGTDISQTDAQIVINSIPLLILFNLEAIQICFGNKEIFERRKKSRSFNLVFTHALFHSLPLMVLILLEQSDPTFCGNSFQVITLLSLLFTTIFAAVLVLPTYMICSSSPIKIGAEDDDEKNGTSKSYNEQSRRTLSLCRLGIGPVQNPPSPYELPILRGVSCQQKPFIQSDFEAPSRQPDLNADSTSFIRYITGGNPCY